MKRKAIPEQIPLFNTEHLDSPPESDGKSTHDKQITRLPIEKISANPWQPRIYFDSDANRKLAENINQVGLLQPILVRHSPNAEGEYELIAGERRLLAYKQLGHSWIAAIVVNANDQQMLEIALAENTSRENLTDFEIYLGIRRAEIEFPTRTRTDLAFAIGIARCTLYRYLAFTDLPKEILEDLKAKPTLMTNKVANELKGILSFHGQAAINHLIVHWKQVVIGRLEPSLLAEAVMKALERQDKVSTTKLKRNLVAGKTRVGSMISNPTATTIHIEAKFIPNDRIPVLAEILEKFLTKCLQSLVSDC